MITWRFNMCMKNHFYANELEQDAVYRYTLFEARQFNESSVTSSSQL